MKDIQRRWDKMFIAHARERGMRTIQGYAYIDDGAMVTTAFMVLGSRVDPMPVQWRVEIKPLALDDILWAAFLPELKLGKIKRRSLRVQGAFSTPSLQLGAGESFVERAADPTPMVSLVLDACESLRVEYLSLAPRPEDFLDQLLTRPEGALPKRSYSVLREALTLIFVEKSTEAVALLRSEIERGETGHMISSDGPVFGLLIKYVEENDRGSRQRT